MNVPGPTAARATRVAPPAARLLTAALVAGLVLRLAFAFGYWVGKPLTLDEQEYLLLAASVAHGDGLRYPEPSGAAVRHFERPPAFAVFLAAILKATGDPLVGATAGSDGLPRGFPASSSQVPAAIKIAQSLLGVLVILLVAALAAQAAGTAAAVVAAWLCAVFPPLVWISGYVLAEPLYSALALAAAWLLNRATTPGRRAAVALALAAGLVAGAAALTKEAILFFVPLAAGWLLVRGRRAAAVVFCAGLVLVLAPWIARNYAAHGRFVLTAPHGGVTFWTGNNELASGEGDLAANPEMGRARVAFERRHAGLSAEALDRKYYGEAVAFIRNHPGTWLLLVPKKIVYTFVPIGPSYRLHSPRYFALSVASCAIALPLAAAGLFRLYTRRRLGAAWALWLLAGSVVLVSVVFFPQERFRIPIIDPTVLVCAATWFASLPAVARVVKAGAPSEQ